MTWSAATGYGCSWLLAAVLTTPLPAQPAAPPASPSVGAPTAAANVLVVLDATMLLPYIFFGRQAFEQTVAATARRPVTIFDETLDLERFPTAAQQEHLRALIVAKYRDRPIDVIVAVGRTGLGAARHFRAELPRRAGVDSIPILYSLDEPGRPTNPAEFPRGPNITGLVMTSPEKQTGRRIRALIPQLRTLAVVASLPEQAAMLTNELKSALGHSVRYVPIVNPSPSNLLRTLKTLPQPAAVFLYRVLRDTDGTGWSPVGYLQQIAGASPAPIFVSYPTYLGEGAVGGAMRDPLRHGTLYGQLTSHVINGADIDTIPPQLVSIAEDAYDWSVMQRFNLSMRDLPRDARVIRKPLYMWQEFPRTTAAVSLLLTALSAVAALLLRNGRQLARANRERRQLAQHLLTVQDAERQRIARDLHDDVCQEMSAIAVELDVRDSIAANASSANASSANTSSANAVEVVSPSTYISAAAPHTVGARTRSPIADRLRTLVERTRLVSHGLHAEPFSYAHLPQVLEQEADALYERHRIACTVQSDGSTMSFPPAITTGVYRIAMEALQNVVKHASASACTIIITQQRQTLTLTIADNGIGFADTPSSGLGVLSMRERATVMGGQLQVTSTPFRGTTVMLTVPVLTNTPVHA